MLEFFLNPDPYYTPKVSIGSFTLKDSLLTEEVSDPKILDCLGKNLIFTPSGKHAIRLALEDLQLCRDDKIGIVTTSGNSYVSKCVTETISEYCDWVIGDYRQNVSCLFVIHEFGALHSLETMNAYRLLEIPIINDFAYSLLSLYQSGREDFRKEINLTSFPKNFNINFGGAISLNHENINIDDQFMRSSIFKSLKNELSFDAIQTNIHQRKLNRQFYKSRLRRMGYDVVWDQEEICPGVCMISPQKSMNLEKLKIFLQRNGIESSVFYGEQVFFVPIHHLMSQKELEYVCFMIGAFEDAN